MKYIISSLPRRARIALGLVLMLGIIAALTPHRPGPVNLATGGPLAGASIVWPLWRYAIEPFAAAAEYILGFSRYIAQLLSWLIWLAMTAFFITLYRRKKAVPAVRASLIAALVCITAVLLVLFLPFPAPRLSVPKDSLVVDFHSHTYYSHDNVMSPAQSLFFHRRLGFGSFFVTEHSHTNGFPHFPSDRRGVEVLPGMQIATKERISLLILGDRPFDGKVYRDKTVQEVIDMAHAAGFAVICPHWWKWRYFTWDELRRKGIDGFEVYNAGYRKFSDEERERLAAFCREHGLAMTSSTDWHGWGYISNAWTVLPGMSGTGAEAVVARVKERGQIIPAALIPSQRTDAFRYVLEPVYGLYYYFWGLDVKQWAGWSLWILALGWVIPYNSTRAALRRTPFLFTAGFACLAVYALIIWLPLLPENMILGRLLAPVLAVIAAAWGMVARMTRDVRCETRDAG